jgi:hypothetical protein
LNARRYFSEGVFLMKLVLSGLSLVLLTACASANAAMQAPQYNMPAPGKVVQDVVVYLSGEAMNSKWHVVSSRVAVGRQNGKQTAYQWYLSIYAPAANGWTLAYRSPGPGTTLLARVTKANGAQLYFPMQSVKIVGGAELEQAAVQDAVVQVHEQAADCGSSTVAVFGVGIAAGRAMKPSVHIAVQNGCSLNASIAKYGQMQAVQLSGPYYGPKAAMCCPTKNNATAKLTNSGAIRGWSVTPNYFRIDKSIR